MGIKITSPGLLTTIQDGGRYGYQKDGMTVSGAMDRVAFRLSNILVGNHENEATMEVTLAGPAIFFEEDHLIALTGADLSPKINGKRVPMWRPVFIRKGSTLTFGKPVIGCRSYLAIAGGFDIPAVMNSASTYLRAGIGGWKGRSLQAGDIIPCKRLNQKEEIICKILGTRAANESFTSSRWTPSPLLYPAYQDSPLVRATTGPEWDWFSDQSQETFWQAAFKITPQSDRMALRLEGSFLSLKENKELLSTAVTFGTVQLPAEGSPIVLMADHPTTGGYPRIAQVITADLPLLAQALPGKSIRFIKATLQEAQELFIQQEKDIEYLKKALQIRAVSGSYE